MTTIVSYPTRHPAKIKGLPGLRSRILARRRHDKLSGQVYVALNILAGRRPELAGDALDELRQTGLDIRPIPPAPDACGSPVSWLMTLLSGVRRGDVALQDAACRRLVPLGLDVRISTSRPEGRGCGR